jgi:predicted permease
MSLFDELRLATRVLYRSRAFSLTAIATLALGIGLNVAIYSAARGTLLSRLPFPHPDRLVVVGSTWPERGLSFEAVGVVELDDHRRGNPMIETLAAFNDRQRLSFTPQHGLPEVLHTTWVTSEYFQTLGATPELGTAFSREHDSSVDPVVVVSHAFWRERLSADASVVGRTIELTGRPHRVLGVMPASFRDFGDRTGRVTSVWVPIRLGEAFFGTAIMTARPPRQFLGIGRVRQGVTIEQVQHAADAVATDLGTRFPPTNRGRGVRLMAASEYLYGDLRWPLRVLGGAAALVLLLCCVNLAMLFLVRWRERNMDLAVRLALGAARSRIATQVMAEGMILSGIGAILSVPVAFGALRVIVTHGPIDLPGFASITLDRWSLALSVMLAVATALMSGFVPAVSSARTDPQGALKAGTRSIRAAGRRLNPLVAIEVALAVVLLVGASLAIRSVANFTRTGLGIDSRDLLTMQMSLQGRGYDRPADLDRFMRALRDELLTIPTVAAAGAWGPNMIGQAGWHTYVSRTPIVNADPTTRILVQQLLASYGALDALRPRLIDGRQFTDGDVVAGVNESGTFNLHAVLIDATVAARLFPGESAVGKQIHVGTIGRPTVVGVVADIRHRGRTDETGLGDVYFPFPHGGMEGRVFSRYLAFSILVRHAPGAPPPIQEIRRAVARVDPGIPISDLVAVSDLLERENRGPVFAAAILTLYSWFAVALAALGLFGVIAYAVRLREGEFAVRLALGARPADVMQLILRQGLVPVVCGLAVGLGTAFALARALRTLLYGLSPADPLSYAIVAGLLVCVAVFAILLPARSARRIDAASTLRSA